MRLLAPLAAFLLQSEVASTRATAGIPLSAASVPDFTLAPEIERSYTRADA